MHRASTTPSAPDSCYPRSCGDEPWVVDGQHRCSPPALGCTATSSGSGSPMSVRPACAGIHRREPRPRTASSRSRGPFPPRARGCTATGRAQADSAASAPRARGCPDENREPKVEGAVGPARAGLHPEQRSSCCSRSCSPRVSGDEPRTGVSTEPGSPFAPAGAGIHPTADDAAGGDRARGDRRRGRGHRRAEPRDLRAVRRAGRPRSATSTAG